MTALGQSRRVPESSCTRCGDKLDAATCVGDDEGPTPGDITICATCGHVMAFADDLILRELTAEEAEMVADEPRIKVGMAAWRNREEQKAALAKQVRTALRPCEPGKHKSSTESR